MRLRKFLSVGGSVVALVGANPHAFAQTPLPEVLVKQPKPAPVKKVVAHKPAPRPEFRQAIHRVAPSSPTPSAPGETPEQIAAKAVAAKIEALDQGARKYLATRGRQFNRSRAGDNLRPAAGRDAPIEKVLLQTPGISQDTASNGGLHLRNEHANVQYRINGVLLPDGVSGFGQVIDSGFVGNVAVIDGALPAQYGLHTSGVVDITSKSGAFDGGGKIGVYGGSLAYFTPSFEYGGTVGDTQYFVTGRFLTSNIGIENPAPSMVSIHDHTDQGKFFGYASTSLGDGGRLSFISGTAVGNYQIPNNPGQPQAFSLPGSERLHLLAAQRTPVGAELFQRRRVPADARRCRLSDFRLLALQLARLHARSDRRSPLQRRRVEGLPQFASSTGSPKTRRYRLNEQHTLRFGFTGSGEVAQANNASIVFPVDVSRNVNGPPFAAPTG